MAPTLFFFSGRFYSKKLSREVLVTKYCNREQQAVRSFLFPPIVPVHGKDQDHVVRIVRDSDLAAMRSMEISYNMIAASKLV